MKMKQDMFLTLLPHTLKAGKHHGNGTTETPQATKGKTE